MSKHCILVLALGIREYFLWAQRSKWVTSHQAGNCFSLTREKRQKSGSGDSSSPPSPPQPPRPSPPCCLSHFCYTAWLGADWVTGFVSLSCGKKTTYFLWVLTSTLLLHKQMYLCILIKPHRHWWQGNE